MSPSALIVAADVALVAHAAFVAFVVVGQALILAGWACRWRWTRDPVLRILHLGAIALVVLESWFGVTCPLTWLEFRLRAAAGSPVVADGFLAYWLQRLIFHEAPSWVFTFVHTAFGAAVAATFVFYPPSGRRADGRRGTSRRPT